ncbi:MAG: hypothetical protein FWC40_02165 [Proteobacteria bacterium]|nr:hypothetical protein [Pseudomonadota bacterium]
MWHLISRLLAGSGVCLVVISAWFGSVACAEEWHFWEDRSWRGGSEARALLESLGEVVYATSSTALRQGDVLIWISPAPEALLAWPSPSSGIQALIFDEGEASEAFLCQAGLCKSASQGVNDMARHVNGNPNLPVIHASFSWQGKHFDGDLCWNHPSPLQGGQPLVGDEAFGYVFLHHHGEVIIRDASLLTNLMLNTFDNRRFVRFLLEGACQESCRYVVARGNEISLEDDGLFARHWESFKAWFDAHHIADLPWYWLAAGILSFWFMMATVLAIPLGRSRRGKQV